MHSFTVEIQFTKFQDFHCFANSSITTILGIDPVTIAFRNNWSIIFQKNWSSCCYQVDPNQSIDPYIEWNTAYDLNDVGANEQVVYPPMTSVPEEICGTTDFTLNYWRILTIEKGCDLSPGFN